MTPPVHFEVSPARNASPPYSPSSPNYSTDEDAVLYATDEAEFKPKIAFMPKVSDATVIVIPDDEDTDDDDDQLQCGQGSPVEEVKPIPSFIDILEPILIESSDEDVEADDSGIF